MASFAINDYYTYPTAMERLNRSHKELVPSEDLLKMCLITSQVVKDREENHDNPLLVRYRSSAFRHGYRNWRMQKPKGAAGEMSDLKEQKSSKDEIEFDDDEIRLSRRERRPSFGTMGELEEYGTRFFLTPFDNEIELQEPVVLSQSNIPAIENYRHSGDVIVTTPTYDRSRVNKHMVHLGVGGFHRSHQAVYTDDLLEKNLGAKADPATDTATNWGIIGVGLMPFDEKMNSVMEQQQCLYTCLSRGVGVMSEARVIGSIVKFLWAPQVANQVMDAIVADETGIVSLTVTEKGYCQNVDGDLDLTNRLVQADLEAFKSMSANGGNARNPVPAPTAYPLSAIGYITMGLLFKYLQNHTPFTVLSCDNLPKNGDCAQKVVTQMAQAAEKTLVGAGMAGAGGFTDWVSTKVAFPNTMVDRITPGTEDAHRNLLAMDFGISDQWPVIAEDFRQWVIEDHFTAGRPNWNEVGAIFTPTVHKYEIMKLRLLNGGHSALSYISYLCGYKFVDDAMEDPAIRRFLEKMMEEVVVTVPAVPGVDLTEYRAKLIQRFANPYIKDTLLRLAEDGSKKLYNTMRDANLELLAKAAETKAAKAGGAGAEDDVGNPIFWLTLAIAFFVRFFTLSDEEQKEIEGVKDPLKEELHQLALKAVQETSPETSGAGAATAGRSSVTELLVLVFGDELGNHPMFVKAVTTHLKKIVMIGTRSLVDSVVRRMGA